MSRPWPSASAARAGCSVTSSVSWPAPVWPPASSWWWTLSPPRRRCPGRRGPARRVWPRRAGPPEGKPGGAWSVGRGGGGRPCLFEEEQAAEEADPDDVDEVPVVADSLDRRQLPGVAADVTLHPTEQEAHGQEADEHVQAVQAGHDEEQRPVGVGVPTGGEEEPLGRLVRQKRRSQNQGEDDPSASRLSAAPFGLIDGVLHGEAARDQHEGEDAATNGVELGAGRRPDATGSIGPDGEEGRKEAAEEHQLRAQPDHTPMASMGGSVVDDLALWRGVL